jgi:hypothetical protein
MNDKQPEGPYTGIERNSDGGFDLLRAARIIIPDQEAPAESDPTQAVLKRAEKAGLDEQGLRGVVQTLRNREKPGERAGVLRAFTRKTGRPEDEILGLARVYEKERVKAAEPGELNHYHQTSFAALEALPETRGLMSYDMLNQLGRTTTSGTGTRPDVVQMTRDRYNHDGKLVAPGLTENTMGANHVDVALVFDPSVMDLPDYDCIDNFPNAPFLPAEKLRAVLANDDAGVQRAAEIVQRHGMQVAVTTRSEWRTRGSEH